ncbi:hypothetical protein CDAR_77831 [Caerostris darwini]|uniref:Uncharacterized protein n=1 Tax=Caerostris darwini TaxID=1538125 RepID=A0AAV4NDB9_9ARAC|nr:hypothetical protein CDAR_77831 [Caerostris darwini]
MRQSSDCTVSHQQHKHETCHGPKSKERFLFKEEKKKQIQQPPHILEHGSFSVFKQTVSFERIHHHIITSQISNAAPSCDTQLPYGPFMHLPTVPTPPLFRPTDVPISGKSGRPQPLPILCQIRRGRLLPSFRGGGVEAFHPLLLVFPYLLRP